MVFNPPVLKDAESEKPTTVVVAPARSNDAYVEQAKRAAGWIGLLTLGWLFQRLMCNFNVPPHCDLPKDALEVLTDLLTLLVFGLTQAWFCEILEERRFRHLTREFYFVVIFFGIGLALSGLECSKWWQDLRFDENGDWTESHVVIVVLFVVALVLIVAWHFAEAWRTLPGAYYVSGNININVVIKENLHRIYNVSRGLIVTYALLYGAFAFDSKDGFQLHYILLAYVLSLIAQFKSKPSIIFLALCTGVFIQGFGAYRLRFLCASMGNNGNGFGIPGSGFGDSVDNGIRDGDGDSFDNGRRYDDDSMADDDRDFFL